MSMKNFTHTKITVLLLFCSVVLAVVAVKVSYTYVANKQLGSFNSDAKQSAETVGDPGDDSCLDVSSYIFEDMPICNIELCEDYFESNLMCAINSVRFTPNKISMTIRFTDLSDDLKDCKLHFRLDNSEWVETVPYIFSNTSYRVTIPRCGSLTFNLTDISGTITDVDRSSKIKFNEIGKMKLPIYLTGKNTMKFVSNKEILIYNNRDEVINYFKLTGFGTRVLNESGVSYQEVIS